MTTTNKNLQDETKGMSMKAYPMNRWRFTCGVMFMLITGMSDSAPGVLLPHMEPYYDINYTVVSMIWMSNAVGFIVVAVLSHKIEQWFGARQLVLGTVCMCVMYAIVTPAPPFPVVVVGFFFGGVGMAMNLSYFNVVVGRFENSSVYMGALYGSYGVTACLGPMVATIMMNHGIRWSIIYSIMLGLAVVNTAVLAYAFKDYEKDVKKWEEAGKETNEGEVEAGNVDEPVSSPPTFHAAISNPLTWLLALFIFFYQGAEISMSGWIVTFLEVYRHGNTRTTGYVSSGLWAGMTVGRVILTPTLNRTIGAKRGITILTLFSLVCCILVWRLDNLVAEAVLVAVFGIFTGPIYPMAITIVARILPKEILIVSLTIITAVGSSGGAIMPFVVGLTSQHVGTVVVVPYVFSMFAVTFVIWATLPNPDRQAVHGIWQRLW